MAFSDARSITVNTTSSTRPTPPAPGVSLGSAFHGATGNGCVFVYDPDAPRQEIIRGIRRLIEHFEQSVSTDTDGL